MTIKLLRSLITKAPTAAGTGEFFGFTDLAAPHSMSLSARTGGTYDGEETIVDATVASGWEYLESSGFTEPSWGPGLRSPDGEVYRNGTPLHAGLAIAVGGLVLA